MTASTDQLAAASVRDDLLAFLTARTRTRWEPDTDLFASGGVSSLFAMELVLHIESTFDVRIGGADLRLDTFRTVDRMTDLVLRLRTAAAGG
jgi:methoxymalonate biosynthesis acyl carrier protein